MSAWQLRVSIVSLEYAAQVLSVNPVEHATALRDLHERIEGLHRQLSTMNQQQKRTA